MHTFQGNNNSYSIEITSVSTAAGIVFIVGISFLVYKVRGQGSDIHPGVDP